MLALRCNHYGGVKDLVVEEVDEPEPSDDEVVVDVVASAVNFPDVLIIADRYQVHVPLPFIPGSEYAGVVSAVGSGVEHIAVGDRVVGAALVGAFAQKTTTLGASVRRVHPNVDMVAAAAFGNTYRTAYLALRSVARIQPGEWLVVLGAAGGVGLATVELGSMLGARVLAAASTDAKLGVCRERGAEAVVNYSNENLKERIRELTSGGAHVVIDPVGGQASEQALRSTRFDGRFVTIGFASGEIPRIPLNLVLLKGTIVTGCTIEGIHGNRPDEAARLEAELWDLLENGRIRPYVGGVFPLEDARDALSAMAERRAVGKIIITPNPTLLTMLDM